MKEVMRMWGGWDIEKVENWLEDMEQNRWSLFKFDFTMMRFKFKKVKKSVKFDTVYQMNVEENYFELFKKMAGNQWIIKWVHGLYGVNPMKMKDPTSTPIQNH